MASACVKADGHDRMVVAAQEAFAKVLPRLPALIDAQLGATHAQIYTREQLARMLAGFAADILALQTADLLHAVQRGAARG
jgi:hypothetical protein